MVSDFIQKNTTILRILIIITSLIYYVSSTLQASDVKVMLNSSELSLRYKGDKIKAKSTVYKYNPAKDRKKNIRIVLDAGHGGHDSGAVGKNSLEKDLALKMALKAGQMIEKKYPDVEVFQTRTTDVFIPLFRRIQYANEQNADIFISIHCNFISNPKTRGTETFVMGLHRANDNLEVAKRENASILLEPNYESNYDGFDPNSPEGHIVVSMYQNNYIEKSIELAANIEEQFGVKHLSKSRGVKQAGFAVLRRSSMPAVLVEAGFLSNEVEEAFLMSDEGQTAIAESIIKAFDKYYANNLGDKQPGTIATSVKDVSKEEPSFNKSESSSKNQSQKNDGNVQDANRGSVSKVSASKEEINNQAISGNKINQLQKFKVQIAAFKNELADLDSAELRKIGALSVRKQSDINKYLVGDFVSRESAEIAREKLKNLGYKGAFIVPASE